MKIAYISPVDPFKDQRAWSGTYYNTRLALEKAGFEVDWIKYTPPKIISKLCKILYKVIYGKGSFTHSRISAWLNSNYLKDNLDKYDYIFCPGQVDIVASLKTTVPIIYYTDGTVDLMLNYYWFGWSKKAIKEANLIEQSAIDNASIKLYASDWARKSAINRYHAKFEDTHVLQFGAALGNQNVEPNSYFQNGTINILFSGVEWQRKGGSIAVDTIKELKLRGIEANLHIVGIRNTPPINVELSRNITNIGFLDKNDPEQFKKYVHEWEWANLFILPTRAECAGIVFCEANAFGIPTITTDTGGIGSYIVNNLNGIRLPLTATGREYANVIEEWVKSNKLEKLSNGAKQMYNAETSWDAWGKKINLILREHKG